jgi:RHS repeat-associated protein
MSTARRYSLLWLAFLPLAAQAKLQDIPGLNRLATYGTASAGSRPHALASISGQAGKLLNPQYHYDARGNILTATASNGARREHSWTSFDNPGSFSLSSTNAQGAREQAQTAFLYGPEHQRIRETSSKTTTSTTGTFTVQKTLAVLHPDNEGSLYFERESSSTGQGNKTENRHYISAPNAAGQGASAFLVITSPGAIVADPVAADLPSTEQRYLHKDQLGSTIATTKPTITTTTSGTAVVGATIIEQLAYEPFGKRRYPAGQFDKTGQIDAQSTPRGFTGHEHLDDLDLIHMNARVYDPDIGRFLSPDPTVPYASNPQSFNRYSYTQNNPLNRVDMSGFADKPLCCFSQAAFGNPEIMKQEIANLGKGPNAHRPESEANTAVNPSNDQSAADAGYRAQPYSGLKDSALAQGVLDSYRLGMELSTPSGDAKAAMGAGAAGITAAGVWAAKHTSGIRAAWNEFKALFTNTAAKAKGGADDAAKAVNAEISAQKQAGHILNTPQYLNRIKQNKPTSTFPDKKTAEKLTREAYEKGTPVPGRPQMTEYDFGYPVGTAPDRLSTQSRVRVSKDAEGRIHGYPSGPTTPPSGSTALGDN